MKKFINDPKDFVDESLLGVLMAYPNQLRCHPDDLRAVYRTQFEDEKKVSIITGGGFGHFPAYIGYVGRGLCDGVAIGNVFSSPSASSIMRVTRAVPNRNGVVYLISNYGSAINFETAADMCAKEGIPARIITVADDVATAPRGDWRNRRGISGIIFIYRLAGAAAVSGMPMGEIARICDRAQENMASFGVAFRPCQIPNTNSPMYEIGEDEMMIGIGISGEQGMGRVKIKTSREIAKITVEKLRDDISLEAGDRVALMVNGLSATPKEEQFIFYRDVCLQLKELGIEPVRSYIGKYATSLEMTGASVTLLRVNDQTLSLLDYWAASPFLSFNTL